MTIVGSTSKGTQRFVFNEHTLTPKNVDCKAYEEEKRKFKNL